MALSAPFALRQSERVDPFAPVNAKQEQFVPATRLRIWELATHLLCSIIGTCLSAAELRRIVGKHVVADVHRLTEVEVHTEGVKLAGEEGAGGKAIQKGLDLRHATWVKRLGRHATLVDLDAAWDDALESGDIPGAYWAVLSHPATDSGLMKRAFGDVHMLSHLVGSANRADIRKLRTLEQKLAALGEKVERQQSRLREAFRERDVALDKLNNVLIDRSLATRDEADASRDGEFAALCELVTAQRAQLELSDQRRIAAECRATTARNATDALRKTLATSETARIALLDENAALTTLIALPETSAPVRSLRGRVVLYVGGHVPTLPAMRQIVEDRGGELLHHDGGVEDRSGMLAGLVSRSDVAVFPVDCVSHAASIGLKRLCRQYDRPFVALRSAGLSSFMAAVEGIAAGQPRPVPNAIALGPRLGTPNV